MHAHPVQTTDDYHDLIVHLLHSGGALWVPGAKPHSRNQAVMFEPDDLPAMLRPHPTNPKQTPVLRGQIVGLTPQPYWCVAIAHLAHTRGCERCEPVWLTAAEQWAAVPNDGEHEAMFTSIDVGNRDEPGRCWCTSTTYRPTGTTHERLGLCARFRCTPEHRYAGIDGAGAERIWTEHMSSSRHDRPALAELWTTRDKPECSNNPLLDRGGWNQPSALSRDRWEPAVQARDEPACFTQLAAQDTGHWISATDAT